MKSAEEKKEIPKMTYTKKNIITGAVLYSIGDMIASMILDQFSWIRFFGMMLLGATLYAIEIPNYFIWIEKKTSNLIGLKKTINKTALAIAFFNPLWIVRHLVFINLFLQNYEAINMSLFTIAFWSFLVNIPISAFANYLIQNKITLNWRFFASTIFSGLMVVYYAMSQSWYA